MKRVLKPTGSTFKRQKISRDKSPRPQMYSRPAGLLSISKFQPHTKQERKWVDNTPGVSATTVTTGTLTLLNAMTQGTTQNTRIGNRVYMRSVHLRINQSFTGPTSPSSPLRLLVVYDKESNGAAPTATDILTGDTISSPLNLNRPGRFLVLMDEYIPVQNGNAAAYFCNRYVKLGLPVLFNAGNAGTIADISSGAIYSYISHGGQSFTATTNSNNYCRLRFEDA